MQGLAPAAAGGRRGRPMRRGAAHAEARIARRLAREQDDHDPRSGMAMPLGQCRPSVQGRRARSAPGRRLRLRAHRNGNGLRRIPRRCLRSEDHRMARSYPDDDQLRSRRPQRGHLPTASGDGFLDPPLGLRHALSVHPIRQSARRSRNRHARRKHRGQLRQRIGRTRHRTVQYGSRQASRPVEKQRPTRMGDHETGALMQQGLASRHHRLPEPGRKGERIPPAKQRA